MSLTARDKILKAVSLARPPLQSLPELPQTSMVRYENAMEKFIETFSGIGGQVVLVRTIENIQTFIAGNYAAAKIITTIPALHAVPQLDSSIAAHDLANIELAILPAGFAVAENGAVWLTENDMQVRVLPFICQQLAVVLHKNDMLHNMQEAYDRIGNSDYNFAAFIAGPSKTADIEQSLVLGAHGPKSMIIFLLDN